MSQVIKNSSSFSIKRGRLHQIYNDVKDVNNDMTNNVHHSNSYPRKRTGTYQLPEFLQISAEVLQHKGKGS